MVMVRVVGVLLLVSAFSVQFPALSRANGVPVRVILTYLNGVSTWGPTDGTGIAEVAKSEGEVHGSVVGLPPLQNETYGGWLLNTKSGEVFAVGTFNTSTDKTAVFDYRLSAEIPDRGWNMFLLTVEQQGASLTLPSARRSLAGYFPNQTTETPQQLPRTGGDSAVPEQPTPNIPVAKTEEPGSWLSAPSLAGLAAIVAAALLIAVPRLRRGR